jgi:hypothetical protein
MKLLNDKGRVLKRREEQLIISKGNSIRLVADFFSEILEAKRNEANIFKVVKVKQNQNLSTKNLMTGKIVLPG